MNNQILKISLKLGLIGGGYWGKNLIREFNKIGFLDSICEINPVLIVQYQKDYPNLNITNNYNIMLERVDAVCVSLPAEMHYKFAKEALLMNKDVYVEKPITLNVDEAEELVLLAKERNRILMVGHLLHYHPAVEKIKEYLPTLGKIKQITANRLNLGIFRTQENVLWSFAPHDISVILSITGDKLPEWVQCTGNASLTKDVHDITNSIMMIKTGHSADSDCYVNINVNWLNPYKEQRMSIICEKGMLLFDDMEKENKLKVYKNYIGWDNTTGCFNPSPIANKVDAEIIELDLSMSPLEKECRHFMDCCYSRTKPITDGEEGIRVLKVLNYLSESLNKKQKINIIKNNYFAHETAIIDDGAIIGDNTKVWHYSHICKGAVIGKNCNIGQNVFIAGDAIIGDNCKVQNNVSIYAGVEAGNYVFFGPSCVLTNDINPRGMYGKNGEYIKTIIEDGVTLGANSTIVCGNTIGKHSLIGAGAVVTKSVEEYSIMVGNPAKRIGTIDEKGNRISNRELKSQNKY
jgi:UDP-2-acetamido-3-amino-2,3-dideoxy-glucuronate N-acetyltransferase